MNLNIKKPRHGYRDKEGASNIKIKKPQAISVK